MGGLRLSQANICQVESGGCLNRKEVFNMSSNDKGLPCPFKPIRYQEVGTTNIKHTLMVRKNASRK